MMAGPADPGVRVISVWESHEARERFFRDRLLPAYAAAGASLEEAQITVFPLHTLAVGALQAV
jgi:hypothetical protein